MKYEIHPEQVKTHNVAVPLLISMESRERAADNTRNTGGEKSEMADIQSARAYIVRHERSQSCARHDSQEQTRAP